MTNEGMLELDDMRSRCFDPYYSIYELMAQGFALPDKNTTVKLVSFRKTWNLGSLIAMICEDETIEELHASTYRIGTNIANLLNGLSAQGRISPHCTFLLHPNQASSLHGHKNVFLSVAETNGWKYYFSRNHSKVLLFRTDKGNNYVIETSANLNDLPNVEIYSVSNDASLFAFYVKWVFDYNIEHNQAGYADNDETPDWWTGDE